MLFTQSRAPSRFSGGPRLATEIVQRCYEIFLPPTAVRCGQVRPAGRLLVDMLEAFVMVSFFLLFYPLAAAGCLPFWRRRAGICRQCKCQVTRHG